MWLSTEDDDATRLETGLAGGSNPARLSRFSGTYSWTSSTLFTLPSSSNIAVWSGAYFHSSSTMNLYCGGGTHTVGAYVLPRATVGSAEQHNQPTAQARS